MDGMRLRLEAKNLYLRVANVTRDNKSYVLLTAYDDTNNELVLELTHEQAGWLEDQFYAANRRYEERLTHPQQANEPVQNPILIPSDRQESTH
ncbi:hypothetical protein [Pseudobacillus wudalianchiensis]|uniref:Uncharacterized protein n=1 Tax=Pseudobacillus wudalianchiensis TaxID=1743143 RepID=A0A1B9ANQ6_9BACI|nr:hypothetical protein [Bacillus wudalianchiensis]OCA85288.1 hypothetical protein A8F95_11505 [Bacillus wudalianchiensis]